MPVTPLGRRCRGGSAIEVELYNMGSLRRIAVPSSIAKELLGRCREWSRGERPPAKVRMGGLVFGLQCIDERAVLVSESGSRFVVDEHAASLGERSMAVVGSTGFMGVAEAYRGSYYKLVPLPGGKPPTLEINGIHMHRVAGTDPWSDALAKASLVVKRGFRVLDTCTGLGYTSIAAIARGASLVYTVEVDEIVLQLAALNPWSHRLRDKRIRIILGDAVEVVRDFGDSAFDALIHDPPRFSKSTSSLYTLELYREFHRILRRGGRLFHYTGEPGRIRGLNLPGRVARLLREAGFEVLGFRRRALGLVAVKM
ncbi:class I SAM-dependent methyltransferase [Aeropyrum pernix]|nr:RsmD family RNA methyltransferase [Aeropyrum pernix]